MYLLTLMAYQSVVDLAVGLVEEVRGAGIERMPEARDRKSWMNVCVRERGPRNGL